MLEASFPNVAVLSHNEIPGGIRLTALGTIQ
jgi:flagellar biosynthesis component FlhA